MWPLLDVTPQVLKGIASDKGMYNQDGHIQEGKNPGRLWVFSLQGLQSTQFTWMSWAGATDPEDSLINLGVFPKIGGENPQNGWWK